MADLLHLVLFGLLVAAIAVLAHVGLRRVRKRFDEAGETPGHDDPPDA